MGQGQCRIIMPLCVSLLLWLAPTVLADVSPGDIVDRTNWEAIEGLAPEALVNWVKQGEFMLKIDALAYTPRDYFPAHALETLEENVGKYEVD